MRDQATMKFQPFVSIVIPVFNGSNYMREAIDSALAQTYPNLEVLVINDGSNDDGQTELIAKGYGDKIRYISKENGGCASALNVGIANMRGEYFSWLSHDDRYMPEKIEYQVNLLAGLEDRETILYGGYEVINEQSETLYAVRPDSVISSQQLNNSLLPLLRGVVHGCSMLIPKKYFFDIGMFDESLPSTQDYALWFEFFRVVPLRFDARILIQSRIHPDQGTHKIDKHVDECNVLWQGFLRRLTLDEMSGMEGTSYKFLTNTAKFLANTPYKEAERLAVGMIDSCLAETLVSVVIPFYNRVGWTIEAIRSVQAQTHQHFEIILVDDGSTDDLGSLLAFVKSDKRIRYFHQDNAGPARARNTGIKHSQGRYICFLDADDVFLPNKLMTQLKFMEEQGILFSHTSYERMDLEGNVLNKVCSGALKGIVFPAIMASCPIAMPTVMARTDILKRNLFPENFEIGEDVCLWIKITSQYELGGIDVVLSRVRVGPATAALNTRKQAMGFINIAFYIVHDPYFSQFERQIKSLVLDASAVFSNANPYPAAIPRLGFLERHPSFSLLNRGINSLRNHGLRVTWQRIRRRF